MVLVNSKFRWYGMELDFTVAVQWFLVIPATGWNGTGKLEISLVRYGNGVHVSTDI